MLYKKCHLPTFEWKYAVTNETFNFYTKCKKKIEGERKNAHLKIFAFSFLDSKILRRKSYGSAHLHGKYFLFDA